MRFERSVARDVPHWSMALRRDLAVTGFVSLLALPGLAAAQGLPSMGYSSAPGAGVSAPVAAPGGGGEGGGGAGGASGGGGSSGLILGGGGVNDQGLSVGGSDFTDTGADSGSSSGSFGNGSAAAPLDPANVPAVHTVKRGDTLWDLCTAYFHNPYEWPRVWSFNPDITNPHWIFPGDQVRLRSADPNAKPIAVASQAPVPLPPRRAFASLRPRLDGNDSSVLVRQDGFIEGREYDAAGTIVGSREEKMMLASGDQAYIRYDPGRRTFTPGERYTVFRPESPISHPKAGGVAGYVVEFRGELRIDDIPRPGMARGTILDAVNPVERGFRVAPLVRALRRVHATRNNSEVSGLVLATVKTSEIIGSETVVFLDRGFDEGVALGNRFFVIRRGDGFDVKPYEVPDDTRYPREVIGEILIVEVKPHFSTGFVTRSVKEIDVGERVEMHQGY